MSQTYIFHRVRSFYPLELEGDAMAIAEAKIKPGTLKVTDAQGSRTVWELPAPVEDVNAKLVKALARIDELNALLRDNPVKRLDESYETFMEKYKAWYRRAVDVLNQAKVPTWECDGCHEVWEQSFFCDACSTQADNASIGEDGELSRRGMTICGNCCTCHLKPK